MIQLTVTPDKSRLLVRFPYSEQMVEKVKLITGRVWNKKLNGWMLPFTKEMVQELPAILSNGDEIQIDPFVTTHLEGQIKQQQEVISIVNNPEIVNKLPVDFKFNIQPFDHQKKAMSLCYHRKSFALFMEMGTGKTKCIVDLMGYWKDYLINTPALIVCPVSVMDNWKNEIKKNQPEVTCVVLSGSSAKKKDLLEHHHFNSTMVYVINYESFWRLEEEFTAFKWGMLVLDESTKIKHRASKQAKAILRLGERCGRKYIMTGTPSPNSPLELFNQIKFLDPTIFGTNWYAFRDRYAVMGGYQGYQVIGWKNLKELSTKLAGISYRVLKKDCLDLPEKIYKEYKLEMGPKLKAIYKSLAEDLVANVNGQMISASVVLAKLTKLRQITSGFVYVEEGKAAPMPENPKLDQLKEILEQIKGHKVVIWTNFREEMAMIKRLLDERREQYAWIDGSVPQDQRQVHIDRFQTDTRCSYFIGQQHAGGIGITLTAGDYCIFFANDYSPEIRLQCEDRLHRIGQKNNVTYIDLILKATIDVSIKSMLRKKMSLSDQIASINLQEVVNGSEY